MHWHFAYMCIFLKVSEFWEPELQTVVSWHVGAGNWTQVLWKNSQPLLLTTKPSLQAQILVFDHGCITDSFQANLLSINRPNAICLWKCSEVSEGWFPSSLPGQVSFPFSYSSCSYPPKSLSAGQFSLQPAPSHTSQSSCRKNPSGVHSSPSCLTLQCDLG